MIPDSGLLFLGHPVQLRQYSTKNRAQHTLQIV